MRFIFKIMGREVFFNPEVYVHQNNLQNEIAIEFFKQTKTVRTYYGKTLLKRMLQ